jgi:hypothetical protein
MVDRGNFAKLLTVNLSAEQDRISPVLAFGDLSA